MPATRSPARRRVTPRPDRHDLTGAVRQRNGVALHDAAEVVAGDHGLVPEIERGSAHAHQDLAGARLRIGPLDAPQRIEAPPARRNLIDFHRQLSDRDSIGMALAPDRC